MPEARQECGDCLKKKVWANGDRMVFESGFAEFDRQTNVISPGNVISNTELGGYVRPHNEATNPIGNPVAPGSMQRFDLEQFQRLDMPENVRRYVEEQGKDRKLILYLFHHRGANGRRVNDGWVVTSDRYCFLRSFISGPTYKSRLAVEEAARYVSDYGRAPGSCS